MSTDQTVDTYIALGSNLEQPLAQVNAAITELARLPDTLLVTVSPWYRSTAIGPGEQPDYINGVAHLRTELPPAALLAALQKIELAHGRERRVRWAARTLDLDILLYGNQVVSEDHLQIPHPRLTERNFVIYPLAEIAGDLQLPDGSSIHDWQRQLSDTGLQRIETSTY